MNCCRIALYTLLGLACAAWGRVDALDIVLAGKAVSAIVVPDASLPVHRAAATELQAHLLMATGVRVPIVEEGETTRNSGLIYLGECRATVAAGFTTGKLLPNGFRIAMDNDNLFLVGDDSDGQAFWILHSNRTRVGTLFAVYHFLEKELNVRWLWPGALGTTIDQVQDFRVASWDKTGGPPFVHARWRDGNAMRAGVQGWAEQTTRSQYLMAQGKWLRRHRFAMGKNMDMAHAFTTWWEKHGEEKPEFFNLLPDGTRRSDPNYFGGSAHLISMSVSEPTFHEAIVADWLATRTEKTTGVDCSENDTPGKCVCEACLALDEPDPSLDFPWEERLDRARAAFEAGDKDWVAKLGSLSDRYARYYLAVQTEARKHDPDAVVMGYAYANYEDPPLNTQLNDRVIIGIVPSIMFPWAPEQRARMRRQWDGWSATGARLFLRPNYTLDGHNFPINFARKLGEDFSYAAAHGLIGTDFDSLNGQWATQGPNLYMLGRLHIEPDMAVDAVLKEYYDAFGSAADEVAAYFEYWARITDEVSAEDAKALKLHWSYFYRNADGVYTPDVMARGRALLQQAQAAATGDERAVERVAFLERGLRNVELTLAAQLGFRAYKARGDIAHYANAVTALYSYRASVEKKLETNMSYLAWAEARTWAPDLLQAMQASDLPWVEVSDEENLLQDGGLEGAAGAWNKSVMHGGFELALDDDRPYEGGYAARITSTDTPAAADGERKAWARWYQTGIMLDKTKSYRFQCRVRTSPDFTGVINLWVTGTKVGTAKLKSLNTSGAWRTLVLEKIEPTGEEVGVYLNTMAGAGTVWFDTVTLAEN